MTGKDMIEIIKKYHLEDLNLKFIIEDGYSIFPNIRTFSIDELCDIGYSSNEVSFEGRERRNS